MKSFEIYYSDLTEEAQTRFNELFGPPETFNHDISPLAIYEQEDEYSCNECRKCGENTCPGEDCIDDDYSAFEGQ
jgi:hypothetical protein